MKSHCRIVEDRNLIGILERILKHQVPGAQRSGEAISISCPFTKCGFDLVANYAIGLNRLVSSRKRRFHRRGFNLLLKRSIVCFHLLVSLPPAKKHIFLGREMWQHFAESNGLFRAEAFLKQIQFVQVFRNTDITRLLLMLT